MIRFTRNILDWLGARGFAVLLAMLIVVGGTWGFIVLADEVTEGETQHMDDRIRLAMLDQSTTQPTPIGPAWFEDVMKDVTALGGVVVLSLVILSVAGFLFLVGKRRSAAFVI